MVYNMRRHTMPVGHESVDTSRGRSYTRVKQPDGSWAWKQRLVMAKKLGRPLKAYEKVGFKDGNTLNCDPDNLYLREGGKELRRYKQRRRIEAAIEMAKFKRKQLDDLIAGLQEQLAALDRSQEQAPQIGHSQEN